ncbi:hypothetical protein [Escherichia coli]|uniref:hypothetical protein n=1 Tax=Escherichia coli TaxID=562 RepID=UPI0021D078F7|nr:hypothetical protein [Escherichia coli]MCU6262428.1 hypothetical protein [Escherichia coli]
MLSIKMKSLIATSFIVLALGSEAYAYDQVAEASSPGQWLENIISLRMTARCNSQNDPSIGLGCPPGKSWYTAGVLVPDGWEMKIFVGGRATITPLNFTQSSTVFKAGSEFQYKSEANQNTYDRPDGTADKGTFVTNLQVSLRKVGHKPALALEARRISNSSNFTWLRVLEPTWNMVTPDLSYARTRIADLTNFAMSSVPSLIAIRYNSKIDLLPGETKDMFEVSEAYGYYTVNVNVTGDASSDLTLVHSSGATGNNVCNGSLQKGNVCKIKANSQISWYGQKQAVANITLSII